VAANYNNSAWFYDSLARLVYGKALVNAQVYLLKFIPANTNILIAGGGTGWVLDELTKIHPSGLTITYVEIAPGMIALSQKRNTGDNKIVFINDAIENVNMGPVFNIVLTPFLFDNFKEENFQRIFDCISILLTPDALWLNCNFQFTGKWWQRVLLKTMFIFFRLICSIEASQLPAIDQQFAGKGYKSIEEKTFFGDFILSRIYKKV